MRPARFWLALCLTAMIGLTWRWGSWVAGGADSWGYVSQAIRWSEMDLSPHDPAIANAPWPQATATFTPLGHVVSPSSGGIVPMYPPGLPWFMALAIQIAGSPAVFTVVPIFGGLTLLLTFLLAREHFGEGGGAAATVLVLSSPIFLYQVLQPMSDVPATGLWLLAVWLALRSGRGSWWALAAGLSAALAIAVRPSLVPMAIPVLGLVWISSFGSPPETGRLKRAAAFVAGALPGPLAIAWINQLWYGSPLRSGYGEPGNIFDFGAVSANLRHYATWFVESQTPLIALALVAPWILGRVLEDSAWARETRRVAALLLAVCAANLVAYLTYYPFEDWSYLRFLLPSVPILVLLMVGVLFRTAARWRVGWLAVACVLLLVALQLRYAATHHTFGLRAFERRYPDAAELVRTHCPPNAAIVSAQHSGSLLFYTRGFVTVRWDLFPKRWLDYSLAWLESNGHPVYFLLEPPEVEAFAERFPGSLYADLAPLKLASTPHVNLYRPNAFAPLEKPARRRAR